MYFNVRCVYTGDQVFVPSVKSSDNSANVQKVYGVDAYEHSGVFYFRYIATTHNATDQCTYFVFVKEEEGK